MKATPAGRISFRVLAQGISNTSDIFNIITDGDNRLQTLKNMDEIFVNGNTLQECDRKLGTFAYRNFSFI